MKSSTYLEINHPKRRVVFSAWSLAIAIALGVYGAVGFNPVHAQATAGRIFGSAPAGETITARSTSGAHRHAKANAEGRYTIGSLPMGVYTVALEKDGGATDKRSNIPVAAGQGAEINFACANDQCAESASN